MGNFSPPKIVKAMANEAQSTKAGNSHLFHSYKIDFETQVNRSR
jgi:hypothetical protein